MWREEIEKSTKNRKRETKKGKIGENSLHCFSGSERRIFLTGRKERESAYAI